jgi:hypothetical protein
MRLPSRSRHRRPRAGLTARPRPAPATVPARTRIYLPQLTDLGTRLPKLPRMPRGDRSSLLGRLMSLIWLRGSNLSLQDLL